MGMGWTGANVALLAKRKGASFKRTVTIGRQQTFLYAHERGIFARHGLEISDQDFAAIIGDEYIDSFLRVFGAEVIDSIDASPYEGAKIIHDLNTPISTDLHGKYTSLLDFSTLEDIFNIPVALKSCIDLIDIGGYYIFVDPCNNYMGHGFFQFSPELFFNFLSHNGFDDIDVLLIVWATESFSGSPTREHLVGGSSLKMTIP